MIIDAIFTVITSVMDFILLLFPSLPPIPVEVTNVTDWVINLLSTVSGLFISIYGSALFIAIVGVTIVILAFESIYHVTLWVIRKLPLPIH